MVKMIHKFIFATPDNIGYDLQKVNNLILLVMAKFISFDNNEYFSLIRTIK